MSQNKKTDPLLDYDPNAPGIPGKLFGLPFEEKDSELVVIPVPWDVTVSYAEGTSFGPQAVIEASAQVDLYDAETNNAWKGGVCVDTLPEQIFKKSKKLRKEAVEYIRLFEKGKVSKKFDDILFEMNKQCLKLNKYVYRRAYNLLESGKIPAVLGGDHGTPLGLMLALSEKYEKEGFGILQIDAHADLRKAYEGFEFSHASIMYNALKIQQVEKLVQVGIRDFCEEEVRLITQNKKRIKTFFDSELQERKFEGKSWKRTCEEIVAELPSLVYVSFDIDGLDPKLCPNTGTPVPGGLEFSEASYLLKQLVTSGRRIIGFDLCEVGPSDNEWDANVGARLLFKLACFTLLSRHKKN